MRNKSPKQCALVTGAAKRIGKAICFKLADMGFDVAIHFNSSEKEAHQLVKELEQKGCHAESFSCDLQNIQTTRKLVGEVKKVFPQLSVLINNASQFQKDDLKSAPIQQLEQHFRIHVHVPFILTQSFAKVCRQGHVINILDTNIVRQNSKHFTYLLSKKTLMHLTQMSAVELAPYIRVNGIAPGLILAPEKSTPEYLNRLAKKIPLKRKGSVENITQTVQFLIENDYLTGQVIFNDGGEHLL
jgi:NAD(P)-dependent dehydrogenase (short-subunit alcohol dehydrogenase family)